MINKRGKITSVSFALMLIVSTFAFAFMIGSEVREVSADNILYTVDLSTGNYYSQRTTTDAIGTINYESGSQYVYVVGEDAVNDYLSSADYISARGSILGASGDKVDTRSPAQTLSPAASPIATPNDVSGTSRYQDQGNGFYYDEITGQMLTKDEISGSAFIVTTTDGNKVAFTNEEDAKRYSNNIPGSIVRSTSGDVSSAPVGRGTIKAGIFGEQAYGTGQLLQGVQWAAVAAGLTMTLGQLFIKDQQTLTSATAGIAAGILVGKASMALIGNGGYSGLGGIGSKISSGSYLGLSPDKSGLNWVGRNAGAVSAGVGAATAWLVYNAMWSKESVSYETVTFNCLPWQAPNGGDDCELCNDVTLPCSEYRCKSLGQSCEIVNAGTKEERCVNVNPRDSSPPVIMPNKADLSSGFEYFDVIEMPPGAGFKIRSKTTETGCLPAYTPIQFGITTNEPSQCKIDIEPKGNYSQMAVYIGGNNLYSYNHTEYLNLPSSADIKNSSISLKNGRELIFYMRCKDAAGNTNEADYALTLCVDPSPDNTAPVVQGTSIENRGCVPADSENATVEFYINEPSECRWDFYDRDYEQMNNQMSCATNPVEINAVQSYTCVTRLSGIARDGNNFYVRCKDQPSEEVNESKRNTNKESYVFNLRRSNQLKLKVLYPNETIYGAVRPAPVELYAETLFGCEDNKAICYYSNNGALNSFIQFFDTDNSDGVHTQRLDLNDGTYTYFVRCVDAGGNVVNASTVFRVSIDTNAPVVARAYEEDGYLKLVTPLNSECVYNTESCDYLFIEGTQIPYANSTVHTTEWFADKTYYIKCRDEYRSEPADCSLIVRPTENFLES